MTFRLDLFPRTELTGQIYPGFGRIYTRPDGVRFPSVTTCLARVDLDPEKVDAISEWRKEVGEEEAKRQSERALTRGRSIHKMAEKYVMGDSSWSFKAMPLNLDIFRGMRKVLDDHLCSIWGVELPLFSETLGVAGCADIVGTFETVPAILDFKGSSRKRSPDESYWIQAATYGLMVQEMYRVNIKKLVILMAYEHDPPECFSDAMEGWDTIAADVISEGRQRLGAEGSWPGSV